MRVLPVGRRGARLTERQPAVRFPDHARSRLPTRALVHALEETYSFHAEELGEGGGWRVWLRTVGIGPYSCSRSRLIRTWQSRSLRTTAIARQNISLLHDGYTGSGRNRLILSRTAGSVGQIARGRHVENFAGFERVRASGYPRFISCSYRCCICGDAGASPCCSWPDCRSRASSDCTWLWRLLARSTLSEAPPMNSV